jgi:hypothetical protein
VSAIQPAQTRRNPRTKIVVALFLGVLAVIAFKQVPQAGADIGTEMDEGLKSAICQQYAKGWTTERIAVELDRSFASFEAQLGQSRSVAEWAEYARQARSEKCA